MIIGGRREVERREDVLGVFLDRVLGDDELFGDRFVGAAFGHQREHPALAVGEPIEWIVTLPGPTDELGDNRRIED